MPGWEVLVNAPNAVAALLVEPKRLEAHRIQVRVMAPAAGGFLFGRRQEPRPVPLPAHFLLQPEDPDVQPAPIGLAQQAADQNPVRAAQEEDQFPVGVVRSVQAVEREQAFPDREDILLGRICFQGNGTIG